VSAGPSAAAKARRENSSAEILLFEKTNHISYATCGIPYALSGVIEKRDKLLVVEAELLKKRFDIDVHLNEEVMEIQPEAHEVHTSLGTYKYDKLVYATGARAFIPPIKGVERANNWSTCRTLKDYDKIKGEILQKDVKHITVIGAGLIGVEVVENLIKIGKKVTLIEAGVNVLPMWDEKFSYFAKQVMEQHGVEVLTDTLVNAFLVSELGK